LQFGLTGVIDVVTAVITANKGEHIMTSIAEETGTAPAMAAQPKPAKKARVAPRRAHVAPKKAKSAKKASPAKKAPKGGKRPAPPATAARQRKFSTC
jgi:hypothetical protein